MRILIVYYSKTGNTETIANAMKDTLKANCEVDMLKIEMAKEYSNLLPHLNPRVLFHVMMSRKPRTKPIIDVSPYDLVCVGTPNWFGRITPPINTFIENMIMVDGKKVIAFVSSGWGKESYADDLKKKLEKKRLQNDKKAQSHPGRDKRVTAKRNQSSFSMTESKQWNYHQPLALVLAALCSFSSFNRSSER